MGAQCWLKSASVENNLPLTTSNLKIWGRITLYATKTIVDLSLHLWKRIYYWLHQVSRRPMKCYLSFFHLLLLLFFTHYFIFIHSESAGIFPWWVIEAPIQLLLCFQNMALLVHLWSHTFFVLLEFIGTSWHKMAEKQISEEHIGMINTSMLNLQWHFIWYMKFRKIFKTVLKQSFLFYSNDLISN